MNAEHGGAARRPPSLTERLLSLQVDATEMAVHRIIAAGAMNREQLGDAIAPAMKMAVMQAELIVTEDERARASAALARKREQVQRVMHRPGRWGHS